MGTTGSPPLDIERLEGTHNCRGLLRVLTEERDTDRGWQAAEALVRLGDARAIPVLCESLEHDGAPARQHAARLLGELRAIPAVRPLIQRLTDSNRYVRAAAAFALGQIGAQEALDSLVTALADEESCVRVKAAEALSMLGDSRAWEALTAALDDESSAVRRKVRAALDNLGVAESPATDESAGEQVVGTGRWAFTLKPASDDPDDARAGTPAGVEPEPVREAPASAKFEPAEDAVEGLIAALAGDDCADRLAAVEKLAAAGEKRAIEPMIQSFRGCDDAYRHRVAHLLAGMGRLARLALGQALDDADPDIRAGAAEAIAAAAHGATDGAKRLTKSLYDPDPGVRRSAAASLERMGWQPPGEAVQAAWLVALDRWDEAVAIGPGAARTFVAALRNRDDHSRRKAADALVRLGPASISPLRRTLEGRDARARALAVWALGELGATDSTDALVGALGDTSPEVREAALVALDKLGASQHFDSILPQLTDEADFVRVTAVEVIGHLGNGRAAEAITGRLLDSSPDVRRVAAETLGRLKDVRSARALLRVLNDDDHGVRYAAEQALEAIEKT
jgi:HEAT repeat protein